MSTKSEILKILKTSGRRFVSGQEIADRLGVSRNSVWKAINALEKDGYEIKSLHRNGYKLVDKTDSLSESVIKEGIGVPCRMTVLESTESTNSYAKTIPQDALDIPHIVVADEQTGGRGRMGRSFFSPQGAGLYMSIAFRPDFSIERSIFTTALAAVAVSRAIEKVTGLKTRIKWVNDIYLKGRKVCGILTEAESNFETGKIDKIIVGIGINCFETSVPEELRDIMISLSEVMAEKTLKKETENAAAGVQKTSDKPEEIDFGRYAVNNAAKIEAFSRNELAAAVADEFFKAMNDFNQQAIIREYKSKSMLLGEQILIYNPAAARYIGRPESKLNEPIRARAIDIDDDGGLVVEYLEGRMTREMQTLRTGEVTVRKKL